MPDNDAQRNSPSYLLAVEDETFLLRDEMRPLRFAMEYGKAELALRDWGVRSTVVVFGSARIPAPEAVVSLRGGALVSQGHRNIRDNVIATGGGPGIMEAANRGAAEVGAPSIGFNITLPGEQEPNAWSTPELTFRFHYFAMRKMHLAMRANALAVFPGGFGTFDELFELLTLLQTGKAPPVAVVLFGRDYWREVINFDALVEHGMIAPRDLELFRIVDTPEEAWEWLISRGLKAHTPPGEAA
jgi:uncharacterized protein (TIGR00730 family)